MPAATHSWKLIENRLAIDKYLFGQQLVPSRGFVGTTGDTFDGKEP
jgi:hypothetical protein